MIAAFFAGMLAGLAFATRGPAAHDRRDDRAFRTAVRRRWRGDAIGPRVPLRVHRATAETVVLGSGAFGAGGGR